jgi:hypothetical protein
VVPEDKMRLLWRLYDMNISLTRKGYQAQGEPALVVKNQLCWVSGVIREEEKTTLPVPIDGLQSNSVVEVNPGSINTLCR